MPRSRGASKPSEGQQGTERVASPENNNSDSEDGILETSENGRYQKMNEQLVFMTEHMTSGSLLLFLLRAKRGGPMKAVSDKVEDKEELGEWVGLCKIDKEGKPRRVVKCSCAVVKEVSGDTESWAVVQEYIKSKGGAI